MITREPRRGKPLALRRISAILIPLVLSALAGCGDQATLSEKEGTGQKPKLPAARPAFLPTINIAPAKGWPAGAKPSAARGLAVEAFASGLDHPRWLYALPNGDVLVAESNAPVRPADNPGVRNWVMGVIKDRAGAGVKSADRITLLRSAGAGGEATKSTFLTGLNAPIGMALVGMELYVADTDAIVKFPYQTGQTKIDGPGVKVVDLPAGDINHHWTKNIVASADGKYLYASVGSNSNAAENGIENEKNRAAIWQIETATGKWRIFASGLRNPVGMAWQPQSGALWTAVNERDELGSDLVPDYMTSVKDGGFYGWPYSYYGAHVDDRVKPANPALVATALKPDYALGAHTASLGLTFASGPLFTEHFAGGAFVGQHGSWNRVPRSGYKVVFVPFADGNPAGPPEDVLTGFLDADGNAQGRPVGVTIDAAGALLVADDVGNKVWKVVPVTGDKSAMQK